MHWMRIGLAPRVRPELDESYGRLRCADWQSENRPLMPTVSKVTGQDVQLELPKRSDYLLLVGTDYSARRGYGELR